MFFRIVQIVVPYVVFLHVIVVDNVMCVDIVHAVVVNVLEVAWLYVDHSVGVNIILAVFLKYIFYNLVLGLCVIKLIWELVLLPWGWLAQYYGKYFVKIVVKVK